MSRYRRDFYELKLLPNLPVERENGECVWNTVMLDKLSIWTGMGDSTYKEVAKAIGVTEDEVKAKMNELNLTL